LEAAMPDRAVIFIDGNNWYHSLKYANVSDVGALDYARISQKLAGVRRWVGTRYYIGQVSQQGDHSLYASQRRFVSRLLATDGRISIHFGRLEQRPVLDRTARELKKYLHNLPTKIDTQVYRDLFRIAERNSKSTTYIEKAVDVNLAVDLVVMAERNEFDTAYILSADGDFTPAVKAVRAHNKVVHAASLSKGAELAAAVDTFIPLRVEWFSDCYHL
jgi:uncharacterized LabA/DUF88 family protein